MYFWRTPCVSTTKHDVVSAQHPCMLSAFTFACVCNYAERMYLFLCVATGPVVAFYVCVFLRVYACVCAGTQNRGVYSHKLRGYSQTLPIIPAYNISHRRFRVSPRTILGWSFGNIPWETFPYLYPCLNIL